MPPLTTNPLSGKTDKLVPYGPARVMLLEKFNLPIMQQLTAFDFTSQDILICSFPKSGSTWTLAIISTIVNVTTGRSKPVDLDPTKEQRAGFYLELGFPLSSGMTLLEAAKNSVSPRKFWTHLPWDLLPRSVAVNNPKIIFVHRNVKDVLVSMYEMYKNLDSFASAHTVETFDAFAESFMQDKVHYAPYFHCFKSYWDRRNEPNVYHLSYEGLHQDTMGHIKRLADFVGVALTDEQAQQIVLQTSFANMSENKVLSKDHLNTNDSKTGEVIFKFMRKGKVSSWKSHISEEMSKKIDAWIQREAASHGLDPALFH